MTTCSCNVVALGVCRGIERHLAACFVYVRETIDDNECLKSNNSGSLNYVFVYVKAFECLFDVPDI